MIELDLPHVFVEYVHIQQHSAQVKVGDRVSKGQVLCFSGQAGFCPEPHLHFQVQPSAENDALTLPFVFVINGMQIKPESGQCYPFRIRNSGI
jgi:murein DD-endopeptidase MepM/ murein hydrolase activator NlpD